MRSPSLAVVVAGFTLVGRGSAVAQSNWAGKGSWSNAPGNWGLMAIHMVLMPAANAENCQLLVFNRSRMSGTTITTPFIVKRVWSANPSEFTYDQKALVAFDVGDHTQEPSTYRELFCAGHTLLADGKVFIAGGHGHPGDGGNDKGIKHIFTLDPMADPVTYIFQERTPMTTEGRWYPTALALPDGDQLVVRGTHMPEQGVKNPALWTPATPGGNDYNAKVEVEDPLLNFYPFLFIDPQDGKPFYPPALPQTMCRKYDLATSGWTDAGAPQYNGVPNTPFTYPSGVNVDGFVLKCGGSPGFNQAQVGVGTTLSVDLKGDRTWAPRGSMAFGRMNHTLVALPDGKVLAMGGNHEGQFDINTLRRVERTQPEMFDTLAAGGWTTLRGITVEADQIGRGYHSTALLLPSADVIIAGGEGDDPDNPNFPGNQQKAQIFSPPYGGVENWKPNRPTINAAPTELKHGEAFSVGYHTEDGLTPLRVSLISLGATTHAYNQHQHVAFLPFSAGEGSTITVNWEARHEHLPGGYYMLFLVDRAGAPSVAQIVRLQAPESVFPQSTQVVAGTVTPGITAMNALYLAENTRFGKITSGIVPTGTYVVFEGTSPYSGPSRLVFEVESKADWIGAENTNDVRVRLEAWDWTTSQYVFVGEQTIPRGDPASDLHERRLSYVSPGGVPTANFVRASDKRLRLKAIWKDDWLPSAVFDFAVDMARWRVRK